MITSNSNPAVKLARALQANRKERSAQGAFVVEGVRLVEEAVRAGRSARLVLYTADLDERGQAAVQALAARGALAEPVAAHVMQAASETRAPAGVLAILPIVRLPPPEPGAGRLTLVLDQLSDPGNLGAILRAADAAGVGLVCLTPGSVDAYNPKVVRAAMGAHFRLPLAEMDWDELAPRLAAGPFWLAEARAGAAYDQLDWRAAGGLIIGGEARGPGPRARALAAGSVHIPMPGAAESLNAAMAAGILLFEAARHRR